MPARPLIVITLAIVAAGAGMLLARAALNSPPQVQAPTTATLLLPPKPFPDVTLIDQQARPFDRARLEQRWSLVFFGFTSCPEVCPTTLAMLAQVQRRLADLPAAERPQVVLVSVDPQRDSVERLASYVRSFDPGFIGVTGSEAAIQQLARGLGVSIMTRPLSGSDYTVDHSTAIFLVDPRGAWRALFSGPHAPEAIAVDYRRILAMDRRASTGSGRTD